MEWLTETGQWSHFTVLHFVCSHQWLDIGFVLLSHLYCRFNDRTRFLWSALALSGDFFFFFYVLNVDWPKLLALMLLKDSRCHLYLFEFGQIITYSIGWFPDHLKLFHLKPRNLMDDSSEIIVLESICDMVFYSRHPNSWL